METIKLSDILAELMIESPQNVLSTNFGFDDIKINRIVLFKLKSDSRISKIGEYNGLPLYKIGNKIILEKDNQILYFVQWIEKTFSMFNGKTASQIKVWRGQPYKLTSGIPAYIFWNILFGKDDIKAIISDSQQTQKGHTFWGDRISDAFDKGYPVYYVDFDQKTTQEIKTEEDWVNLKSIAYGDEQKHQSRRFVIVKDHSVIKNKTT